VLGESYSAQPEFKTEQQEPVKRPPSRTGSIRSESPLVRNESRKNVLARRESRINIREDPKLQPQPYQDYQEQIVDHPTQGYTIPPMEEPPYQEVIEPTRYSPPKTQYQGYVEDQYQHSQPPAERYDESYQPYQPQYTEPSTYDDSYPIQEQQEPYFPQEQPTYSNDLQPPLQQQTHYPQEQPKYSPEQRQKLQQRYSPEQLTEQQYYPTEQPRYSSEQARQPNYTSEQPRYSPEQTTYQSDDQRQEQRERAPSRESQRRFSPSGSQPDRTRKSSSGESGGHPSYGYENQNPPSDQAQLQPAIDQRYRQSPPKQNTRPQNVPSSDSLVATAEQQKPGVIDDSGQRSRMTSQSSTARRDAQKGQKAPTKFQ